MLIAVFHYFNLIKAKCLVRRLYPWLPREAAKKVILFCWSDNCGPLAKYCNKLRLCLRQQNLKNREIVRVKYVLF